jgi:hypothetical protein
VANSVSEGSVLSRLAVLVASLRANSSIKLWKPSSKATWSGVFLSWAGVRSGLPEAIHFSIS